MTNAQFWIAIIQLVLTGFLGIAAALIAAMQWRTAHQKMILDLYESREKVLEEIMGYALDYTRREPLDIPSSIITAGRCRNLFANDAFTPINDLMRLINKSSERHSNEEIVAHMTTIIRAVRPYMRMDQKLMRTPGQWYRDRNALRKSFGDQPAEGPPAGGPAP